MAFTPNFQIEIPDVGADFDTWGGILNNALGTGGSEEADPPNTFDQVMQDNADAAAAAQASADAALPKAGGAMSGRLDGLTSSVQLIDLGITGGTNVVNMDLALANFFLSQPASGSGPTYTFINAPTVTNGVTIAFISIVAGGLATIAWDPLIRFPNGVNPVLTPIAGATDLVGFYSPDDGATWFGSLSQSAVI